MTATDDKTEKRKLVFKLYTTGLTNIDKQIIEAMQHLNAAERRTSLAKAAKYYGIPEPHWSVCLLKYSEAPAVDRIGEHHPVPIALEKHERFATSIKGTKAKIARHLGIH